MLLTLLFNLNSKLFNKIKENYAGIKENCV